MLPGGTFICFRPSSWQVTFEHPVDPTSWLLIPAPHYSYLVYLHGQDHPQEHWPEGVPGRGAQERIKAWRYQVDYEQDLENALADAEPRARAAAAAGLLALADGAVAQRGETVLAAMAGHEDRACRIEAARSLSYAPEPRGAMTLVQLLYDPDARVVEEALATQINAPEVLLRAEAIEWQATRGSRSGRVAWQYFTDLAGRRGVSLSG